MSLVELRESSGEIRSVDTTAKTALIRTVQYNVVDSYGSVWEPGVFSDSLRQRKPSAVWGHREWEIFGSVRDFDDSSPHYLDTEIKFADFNDVPLARMAYSLMKDGHVKDTSFRFARYDGGWSDTRNDPNYKPTLDGEVERIRRARLDEVSPVLVGAVPGSQVMDVRSDGKTLRLSAADIYSQVACGRLDIRDALAALDGIERPVTKGEALRSPDTQHGSEPQRERIDVQTGTRDTVTEADIPKNSNGQLASMKRTPHSYTPTNGDGSVCKVCGAQQDIKAHGQRGMSAAEVRDAAVALNSDPVDGSPEELISATDAALDAALALVDGQDLESLPWWVSQLIALVQSADCSIDAVMDAMNIPDPDDDASDDSQRSLLELEHRATEEPDPELDAMMAKLDGLLVGKG